MDKMDHIKEVCSLNRRDFLAASGFTCGLAALPWLKAAVAQSAERAAHREETRGHRSRRVPLSAFGDVFGQAGWLVELARQ